MRSISSKKPLKSGFTSSAKEKNSEYIDSRTLLQRVADRQPKEVQSEHVEKYRSAKVPFEPKFRTEKNKSPELEKQRYSELLQNTQKELQITRANLIEQQNRFEKLVKEQKLRINEIEMENLKLTKELSSVKGVLKKELDALQEKDHRIITDYQKKLRDSEDQNKFFIQEHLKSKQNLEREIQSLKGVVKDTETKLEAYKREVGSFQSKSRKDVDDLAYKEEFIKKLQESIKDKNKNISEIKTLNDQILKSLQEKEEKLIHLEKDLKKERDLNKVLAERFVDSEKGLEKNFRGRSGAEKVRSNNYRYDESQDFEGSLERSLKKARISLIHHEGEEGLLRLKNQVIDLELKVNKLTSENLQIKRDNLQYIDRCRSLEEDLKGYRSLISRGSKESILKFTPDRNEGKNDAKNKLTQVLKEKDKLEKFYRDLVVEFDGNKKKLEESEQINAAINGKHLEVREYASELQQENEALRKKLVFELGDQEKLKNFYSELKAKLEYEGEEYNVSALCEHLERLTNKDNEKVINKLIQENSELHKNTEKISKDLSKIDSILKENERLKETVSESQGLLKVFDHVAIEIDNIKESLGISSNNDLEHKFLDLAEINKEVLKLIEQVERSSVLQNTLNSMTSQTSQLKEEINKLSRKIEMKNEKVISTRLSNRELIKRTEEYDDIIEKLEDELKEFRAIDLKKISTQKDIEIHHLKSEISRLEVHNSSLQLELSEKDQQKALLKAQLSDRTQEINEIMKDRKNLNEKNEAAASAQQMLLERLKKIKEKKTKLKVEAEDCLTRSAGLEELVQELSEDLENLKKNKEEMQSRINELEFKQSPHILIDEDGKDSKKMKEVIGCLEEKLREQEENLEKINEKNRNLEKIIENLEAEFRENEKKALKDFEESVSQVVEKLNRETAEKEMKNEEVLRLEKQISGMNHFIESLETRNRVQLKDINKLETEASKKDSLYNSKTSELEEKILSLESEVKNLTNLLDASKSQASQLEIERESLSKQLDGHSSESSSLAKLKEGLEHSNKALEENLQSLQTSHENILLGLRNELASANDLLGRIQDENQVLESSVKALQFKFAEQHLSHESEKNMLNQQHLSEVESLSSLSKDQINIFIDLENIEALQYLKSEIGQITSEKRSLEDAISRLEQENLLACNEKSEAKKQLADLDLIHSQDTAKIKALELEIQDLNKLLDEENMQSIEDSLIGNDSIKLEIESKEGEIKQLKEVIEAKNQELENLSKVLNEKVLQCEAGAELRKDLEKANKAIKDLEEKGKLNELLKAKLNNENKELKGDNLILKEENYSLHKRVNENDLSKFEEELEEMNKKIEDLVKDINFKEEYISEVQKESDNCKEQLRSRQDEIENLKEQSKNYKNLSFEFETKVAENEELKKKLVQKENEASNLSQNNLDNEKKIKDLEDNKKSLSENLKDKEAKLKLLESQKRQSQNEIKDLELLLKDLRHENYNLSKEIETAYEKEKEIQFIRAELEEHEHALELKIKSHERKIEDLIESKSRLAGENLELTEEVNTLKDRITESGRSKEAQSQLELQLKSMKEELNLKNSKILQAEADKKKLLKEAQDLEESSKGLRAENYELHLRTETAVHGEEELKQEISELLENKNSLLKKIQTLESKYLESAAQADFAKAEQEKIIKDLISETQVLKEDLDAKSKLARELELELKKIGTQSPVKLEELTLKEKQLKDLAIKHSELEKKQKAMNFQINIVKTQKKKLEEDLRDREAELKDLRYENIALVQRLESMVDKSSASDSD